MGWEVNWIWKDKLFMKVCLSALVTMLNRSGGLQLLTVNGSHWYEFAVMV